MCKKIKLPAYMNDQTTNQSYVVCSSEVKQAVSTKEGRDVAQKSPTAARPWAFSSKVRPRAKGKQAVSKKGTRP
jgi:hypothetical protein